MVILGAFAVLWPLVRLHPAENNNEFTFEGMNVMNLRAKTMDHI